MTFWEMSPLACEGRVQEGAWGVQSGKQVGS